MWKAIAAGVSLLMAGNAAAQSGAPDWLRDLPSVQTVRHQIQGANLAQTLGRQCAALTRLQRGADVPAAFQFNPTPPMAALAESYREGIRDLQRRYNDAVKSLDDAEDRREWDRMCGNRRSGVHPLTGEPDSSFPALDETVSEEDFVALLGPAARAAYEVERDARSRRSAQMDQQRESAMAAADRRDAEAMQKISLRIFLLIAIPALGIALIGWMLRALAGTVWQPAANGRGVLLRTSMWGVHERSGRVQACDRSVQTVIREGRVRNENGPDTVHRSVIEIVHWRIRLSGVDGRSHDLHLKDWDISVQPGDLLQTFALQRKRRDSGPVLIVNRTTGQSWNDGSFIHGRLVPVTGLVATPLVVVAGLFTAGIGWLFGFWWMRRAMKRAREQAAEVVQWLEGIGPGELPPNPSAGS